MAPRISAPVGRNAVNKPPDVRAVKRLLNKVPVVYGGLNYALDENALVDQNTVDAIMLFQRKQFGSFDGVVNPEGRTFRRMTQVADGLVAWGSKVSPVFKAKVCMIAARLQTCPDYLMAAMAFETGETFDPAIHNAAGSGAIGLIQFMPRTAVGLGTSGAALAAMSAIDQLDYVDRYLTPYSGHMNTLVDLYVAILLPRAVGKADSTALFDVNVNAIAYHQNKGIDRDHDGKVTKAEAGVAVQEKLNKGLLDGFIG